jgi:hypothetical protein
MKLKFELNLLENSHDYIINSFDLFKIADEYGTHDEQRTKIENKVKWKLAYVTMVQAFELLLKEVLHRIHPNLIYENIDLEKVTDNKTVTFHQAINRVNNFKDNLIDTEKRLFLINCSKLRNEFIHYKVNIQSEQIKSKYCMLYSIYKELHNKLLGEDVNFNKKRYLSTEGNILSFDEYMTVFRGREVQKDDLINFKKELSENSKYNYYITKNGEKVERIKYGDENKRVSEEYKKKNNVDFSFYNSFEICDDCYAKQGEFHNYNCDLEICPVCFDQIISCRCNEVDEEGFVIRAIE